MGVSTITCRNHTDPILLVDDDPIDIKLARMFYDLSDLPNPLIALDSGEALIAHLDSVIAGGSAMPCMILLDVNMPRMNGFEALKAIRSQEAFSLVPAIVMLTHSDSPEDYEKSLFLGANDFCTKCSELSEYVAFFNSLKSQSPAAG